MSQNLLHQDRNGCALHGAIKLLDAIKGVVPVVHANTGCSLNARFSSSGFNAAAGRHFRGAMETSATTLYDKHVVFGGTSRLREQIKNTVKVLDADLYVVVSGCVPEIVGDDLPAMVKEAREQQFPVLGISSPGFKGNAYAGYEHAAKGVLEGVAGLFDLSGELKENRVNLFGLVPEQDPFWEGDLLELEEVLDAVGLEANRLLGIGQDVKDWKQASRARLSLVLSPWGLAPARFLEERYGTPYLYLGWLPVGARDVGLLLEKLAVTLALGEDILAHARERFERRTRYFLQKAAQTWLRHDFQKDLAIVANSAHAVGLARFLAGTLGQFLKLVIITDQPDEQLHAGLIAAIHEEAPEAEVMFSASQQTIAGHLGAVQPEVILGSWLEAPLAARLGVPLLQISTPLRQTLVLNRSYAGFKGALALVEDYAATLLRARPQRKQLVSAEVIFPRGWNELQAHEGGQVLAS